MFIVKQEMFWILFGWTKNVVYLNRWNLFIAGQQQIIKILPNNSGEHLKAISKHGLRDATKVATQVT